MVRLPQNLHRKISQTIRRYEMFQPGEAILVAVSGGADSIALLHILLALPETRTCRIGAAHLNHRLRGEASDADAAFVRSLCNTLSIPLFESSVDCRHHTFGKGVSLEDAARKIRYDFLEKTASLHAYDKIALGHHADDNAEQVLLALLRGSGVRGSGGIPPIREGRIVRPLIRIQRSEIRHFLLTNHLSWVEDETNRSVICQRNAVRIEILPLLERRFSPAVPRLLSRFAEIALDEDEWIETLLKANYDALIRCIEPNEIRIPVSSLQSCHPALQRRILRNALTKLMVHRLAVDFTHIEGVRALLDNPETRSCHLPDNVTVQKTHMELVLRRSSHPPRRHRSSTPAPGYRYLLDRPKPDRASAVYIPEIGLEIHARMEAHSDCFKAIGSRNPNDVFFDSRTISFPLVVRSPRPGDRIHPFGMKESRKIGRYLIDAHIPRDRRTLWPMVESQGRILWLCGLRRSAWYPVVQDSHTVLHLSIHVTRATHATDMFLPFT